MTQLKTKTRSQTKIKLMVDLGIFIGFPIAMEPRSSGLAVHE